MRSLRAEDHRRARLILLLDAGRSYTEIQKILSCGATCVSRWKQRFLDARISGLFSRHPGRAVQKGRPQLEARILAWTQRKPTDGSTHWSVRKLAKHLGVPKTTVARVWQRAGLKPHRIERYMASDDPDFETKAADIIGLYMNPPRHAAVFCVDEKTAIQALDLSGPRPSSAHQRVHREIHIIVCERPAQEAHGLYPPLQQSRQAHQMEL